MNPSLLLIFNHTPSELQLGDARASLGVEKIAALPEYLAPFWDSVPPEADSINDHLKSIRQWVAEASSAGDYILIQGDFGATYLMVRFALEKGLIPIYSTTERVAAEEHKEDGSVTLTHHFRHVRFRKYGE
jgi:hypothetical protein